MTSTSRCQTTYSPNLKESRFEPPPSAVWSRLRPPGSTRDTHVFLWAIAEDLRLTATHRRIYLNGATELWLSVASMWEVLIESGLGKLDVPLPAAPWLTKQIETNRVSHPPIPSGRPGNPAANAPRPFRAHADRPGQRRRADHLNGRYGDAPVRKRRHITARTARDFTERRSPISR